VQQPENNLVVKCKLLVDTGATVSIVSNDIYQKIPDVARPTLTSTNQDVLTASGDKLKILGRGNFLMKLDDTKNVSFASTKISVSYVSLFAESSTTPLIIISL
jgi:hypothetical protein